MNNVISTARLKLATKNAWRIGDSVGPVLAFAGLLLAWEASVRFFAVPAFILPPPSSVFVAFVQTLSDATTIRAILNTMSSTLMGFVIGTAVGIVLAPLIFVSRFCARTLHPLLIGIQTIPKVTLAPLMLVWFGLGLAPKLILIGIITFFPVLTNVLTGLGSVDQKRLDLFKALGANRWQIMKKLRLPTALPYLFSALEVTAIYALIGAIIVEFVGSQGGVGSILLQRNYNLDIAGVFSIILALSLLGIAMHSAVTFAKRRIVFWIGDQARNVNPL